MSSNPTRFDLARPCRTCPFRVDGQPVLLGYERREEIASALAAQQTFLCHEGSEYTEDEDGEERVTGGPQCAGAVLTAGAPQLMRIYERFGGGLERPVVYPEPTDAVPWDDAEHWLEDMESLP